MVVCRSAVNRIDRTLYFADRYHLRGSGQARCRIWTSHQAWRAGASSDLACSRSEHQAGDPSGFGTVRYTPCGSSASRGSRNGPHQRERCDNIECMPEISPEAVGVKGRASTERSELALEADGSTRSSRWVSELLALGHPLEPRQGLVWAQSWSCGRNPGTQGELALEDGCATQYLHNSLESTHKFSGGPHICSVQHGRCSGLARS